MADGNEYYREANLKRFTKVGAIVLFVLVAGGFLLKYLADQQIAADGRDAMGLLRSERGENASQGRSGPLARFQAETPGGMPVDERIRRWQEGQGSETTGATGPTAPPPQGPAPPH